ncbi:MAG: hypothetical protein KGZ80_09120 [Methylomonas sp.]|nr:hypothetical protein [Methylomonas sp.]PPD19800.1 MAG: hypothetical protein CTY23_10835 [Methylomonas sp.]PPD25791.1 MAG: hypothetical protein CTY22_07380 [Methylomonas sp.]PPD36961.1 MAG: hypothetical protein CTY17_11040 [Methylomonas sp.]PPD37255.1 MAG: hypothetical protein CTY21_07380 [Methylomonas sp.]
MSEDSSRRQHERRQHERRSNPHPFNSAEWLAVIQQQYVLWPKQDRRITERRDADRRHSERRSKARNGSGSLVRRPRVSADPLLADRILDDDEKAMILALFADDDPPNVR